MALLHHPSCGALRETARTEELDLLPGDTGDWLVAFVQPGVEQPPTAEEHAAESAGLVDYQLLQQLQERAAWV